MDPCHRNWTLTYYSLKNKDVDALPKQIILTCLKNIWRLLQVLSWISHYMTCRFIHHCSLLSVWKIGLFVYFKNWNATILPLKNEAGRNSVLPFLKNIFFIDGKEVGGKRDHVHSGKRLVSIYKGKRLTLMGGSLKTKKNRTKYGAFTTWVKN